MPVVQDKLLSTKQAAEILSVSPETLAVWRHRKQNGLPYVSVGGSIRYRLSDIEAYVSARTTGSIEAVPA